MLIMQCCHAPLRCRAFWSMPEKVKVREQGLSIAVFAGWRHSTTCVRCRWPVCWCTALTPPVTSVPPTSAACKRSRPADVKLLASASTPAESRLLGAASPPDTLCSGGCSPALHHSRARAAGDRLVPRNALVAVLPSVQFFVRRAVVSILWAECTSRRAVCRRRAPVLCTNTHTGLGHCAILA